MSIALLQVLKLRASVAPAERMDMVGPGAESVAAACVSGDNPAPHYDVQWRKIMNRRDILKTGALEAES